METNKESFEYTIPEGYEAEIKDGKVILKKKESEDERIRKMLIEQMERWKKCAEDNNVEQDVKDASDAIAYLEKQKEQNPAEWSEKHVANIFEKVGLAKIAREQGNDKLTNALQDAMIELSKVETPEWSKEAEDMFESIIATCRLAAQDRDSGPAWALCKMQERFLKSFRSRPKSSDNWKPSKKQIDALNSIILIGSFSYVGQTQDLISLKEDLKKLM